MRELAVPFYRPVGLASCGPGALLSALRYFDICGHTEKSLKVALRTDHEGTYIEQMQCVARRYVAHANSVARWTCDDLENAVSTGAMVICLLEAWGGNHFAVVLAVTPGRVYFADPAYGDRRYITRAQMATRWSGEALVLRDGRGRPLGRARAMR